MPHHTHHWTISKKQKSRFVFPEGAMGQDRWKIKKWMRRYIYIYIYIYNWKAFRSISLLSMWLPLLTRFEVAGWVWRKRRIQLEGWWRNGVIMAFGPRGYVPFAPRRGIAQEEEEVVETRRRLCCVGGNESHVAMIKKKIKKKQKERKRKRGCTGKRKRQTEVKGSRGWLGSAGALRWLLVARASPMLLPRLSIAIREHRERERERERGEGERGTVALSYTFSGPPEYPSLR